MSVNGDDEFQHELITLFVQEAHEWLQQVHVALDELQQGPPPERHIKLAQTMTAGLTNLGGSAATVNLLDVEQSSFAAIPFVEAVADPSAAVSANAFLALCKQLGLIQAALTKATGEGFEADAGGCAGVYPLTMPADDLLAALRSVQAQGSLASGTRRNLIQTVIGQVEGLLKSGVQQCDINSLRGFLTRVADDEQVFWDAVHQQSPMLLEGMAAMSRGELAATVFTGDGTTLAERAGMLSSASQQVNAVPAMTFFSGLHGFLTVVGAGRACPGPRQVERVGQRLQETLVKIQAWIEAGREERRAIEGLLPVE